MSGPGRSDVPAARSTFADFGPAEFLVEPLPGQRAELPIDALDSFVALTAMSDEERIALFT
jgi:hypothetical protein